MTVREILGAMTRRWYLVIFVMAAAALVAVFFVRDGGLYASKTVISFTLPGKATLLPENGLGDESVISFASTVAQEINDGRPALQYAAADAPFYGAGVREGFSVGLPNVGGQWVTNFNKAQIEIRIVGRTLEWVSRTQTELLEQVTRVAETTQTAAGIPVNEQISATVAPLTTKIEHIESSRSSQIAAFASIGLAAVLVAAWLSLLTDRLHSLWSRRTPAEQPRLLKGATS